MGLKFRWFRRRLTFDGIPSGPEKNIREKQTAGIVLTGVYKQYKDVDTYNEPLSRPASLPPIKIRSSLSISPGQFRRPRPQTIATTEVILKSTETDAPLQLYSDNMISSSASIHPEPTREIPVAPAPRTTGINYNEPVIKVEEKDDDKFDSSVEIFDKVEPKPKSILKSAALQLPSEFKPTPTRVTIDDNIEDIDDGIEDDEEYSSWSLIEEHRTNINHTMDSQVAKDIPPELTIDLNDKPKTLRDMKNHQKFDELLTEI